MGKYIGDGGPIRRRGILTEKEDAEENLVKLKFILGMHVLEINTLSHSLK